MSEGLPPEFLERIASYLQSQEEQGNTRIEISAPWQAAPKEAPPPPEPRLPMPKVEVKPVQKEEAPPPPPLWQLRCLRKAGLNDSLSREESTLLVIIEPEEWRAENQVLLRKMLAAIGYEVDGDAAPMGGALPAASRILCLGQKALKHMQPESMELGMLRGLWQKHNHARLMASYPPSLLHNNPAGKKAIWADLKNILKDLNLSLPTP